MKILHKTHLCLIRSQHLQNNNLAKRIVTVCLAGVFEAETCGKRGVGNTERIQRVLSVVSRFRLCRETKRSAQHFVHVPAVAVLATT